MPTLYVTKYALTAGIQTVEAEEIQGENGMIAVRNDRSKGWGCDQYYHGEGKEWHRTMAAAVSRAREMRDAKIASHQKAIAKLQKISFRDGE